MPSAFKSYAGWRTRNSTCSDGILSERQKHPQELSKSASTPIQSHLQFSILPTSHSFPMLAVWLQHTHTGANQRHNICFATLWLVNCVFVFHIDLFDRVMYLCFPSDFHSSTIVSVRSCQSLFILVCSYFLSVSISQHPLRLFISVMSSYGFASRTAAVLSASVILQLLWCAVTERYFNVCIVQCINLCSVK